MAKKGKNIWEDLKGVKETLTEDLTIKMGEVEVTFPVKFVDYDEIQEINRQYDDKLPEKPVINIDIGNKRHSIRVPNAQEKFESFNDHPKAKEWQEKAAPVERERKARIAYEFIADDFKPGETVEEGVEFLLEELREMDRLAITEKGFELNGISERLDKAEKNS